MNVRLRRLGGLLTAVWLCFDPTAASSAEAPTDSSETRRAHALFESHWEETARLYPEWATFRGDHRFGDRLTDASPGGLAERDAYWRSLQQRVKSLDVGQLSAIDRVSVELLLYQTEENLLFQQFDGFRTMTVSAASFAFQSQLAGILRANPVSTAVQVEQMLARMAAYPHRVEQEIARLRQGMAAGWVPPRAALERVLTQLDAQLANPPEHSAFFEPFKHLGSGIDAAEQERLRARGARAISDHVLPAQRKLRAFVAGDYLAAAPADGALSSYPSGDRVYAALVRTHTTTALTPPQIHAIGLKEVARLRSEMEALMRSTGFTGDFVAFIKYLNTDPKFFHDSADALLAGYRDIAKRIDPELPRLFAELPRATYGIRALPAFMGPGAAETYDGPSLDGTRPGWFNANAVGYKIRPKWSMATLVAHEAVPGHHLQGARAAEMKGLPAFRRDAFFTAYGEGWALYAETLGTELGLYSDPYSRFGFLQAQLLRAARLVVDTGIHALGWTRQQAIDYMIERTGLDPEQMKSEVDRYISWPAQALAYMVGQMKIIELRDRARAALGDRFDIRRFHMVVLDSGPVPLDVLERLVDEWIAAQKAGAPH